MTSKFPSAHEKTPPNCSPGTKGFHKRILPDPTRKRICRDHESFHILPAGRFANHESFPVCSYESTHETGIRNLFVIKALQSLTSRGYVKTQFSWQYYYYTLTPEGLDYLREWLHLPAEIVPATHIKQQRSHAPPRGMMGEEGRERRGGGFGGRGRGGDRGDREGGYRRRDAGEGKEGGAPGEFAPQL